MRTWEELSEKEQLLSEISDVHKDAYGFRPRGRYNDWSVSDLKVELDSLYEEASAEYERMQKAENASWIALKAHFANLVNMGAKDFRQALDWDMQAEDCAHDGYRDYGFYCYHKNIAYGKQRTLERLAA